MMDKLIAVPFSLDDLAASLEEYAQDYDKWKDPRYDDLMTAAAYLREYSRAQPENKPLTLEEFCAECELRRQSGAERWLWCEDKKNADATGWYRVSRLSEWANIADYGKTWLAYRRKPERSEG